MRTTERTGNRRRPLSRTARIITGAVFCCLALVALLGLAACFGGGDGASSGVTKGAGMSGPSVELRVSPEALASKPKPPVLSTPESAVRSYLDWVSYAYRIGTSDVATSTMTTSEMVRVDAYSQYNLEKGQVIDQTLDSITFGKLSVGKTGRALPAKEKWTYRYVSIETAGKTIGGPYTASYDTTYTLVRSPNGKGWVVASVAAKPVGKIK